MTYTHPLPEYSPSGQRWLFGRLSSSDASAFTDHWLRLSDEDRYLRFFRPIHAESLAQHASKAGRSPSHFFLGAWNGGLLVGSIEGALTQGCVELALSLDPQHRRQGLAKRLLWRALRDAHERGAHTVMVDVMSNNEEALGFFLKHLGQPAERQRSGAIVSLSWAMPNLSRILRHLHEPQAAAVSSTTG